MDQLSSMRQLEERQVDGEVDLLVWSPKMDILAMTFHTGEVAMYRMNWQKLWSLPAPSKGVSCSSLAWRPDGKVLAAGYTNGEAALLDIETAEVIRTNRVGDRVTTLTWIKCEDRLVDSKSCDATWDFLTKFPLLSKAYSSNSDVQDDVADCQKLHEGGTPTVLLAGTSKGHISIFLNGFLLVSRLNVCSLMSSPCSIKHVTVAQNLSSFSVMALERKDGGAEEGDDEDGGALKVAVLSMPLLATCFGEFETLSRKFSILQGTLDYLADTIKQIQEAWFNIINELDAKLASYAKMKPNGGMAADFLEQLLFGTYTPELENFLVRELTEKGLKKMNSSIDTSYLNVQRLVMKYLQTVCQSLNYYLSELAGLAKASEKFGVLGVTLERIGNAQKKAASFWCKAVELQQVIDESRKTFSAFFKWMHAELLKITDEHLPEHLRTQSQQEIAFIAEFLYSFDAEEEEEEGRKEDDEDMMDEEKSTSGFTIRQLEKVGQYLKDADLQQPADRKRSFWNEFLEQNPDLKGDDMIVQVNPKTSLVQEHQSLKDSINVIFDSMFTEMTDKCQYLGELRLPLRGSPSLSARQFESREENKIFGLAAHGSRVFDHGLTDSDDAGDRLLYYELELSSDDDDCGKQPQRLAHKLSAVWISFDEHPMRKDVLRMIDSQFYESGTVSVFVSHVPVGDNQRVIQLPTENLRGSLRELPISSFQPLSLASGSHVLETRNIFDVADMSCHRELENIAARQFSVSGPRNVAAFVFRNKKRIRIYDMDQEEDDDDEDETLGTSGLSTDLNTSG